MLAVLGYQVASMSVAQIRGHEVTEVQMATRKDLLKAQAFTSRRMIAAFVDRDPDDPTPPLKRIVTATFVSVLIGVILLAGSAIIGMIRPGGSSNWAEDGVVISDSSSGMQFIYISSQESLQPMLNTTSARIAAAHFNDGEQARVINVDTESLRGAKQGPLRGIPDAPRQLPDASNMNVYPLTLCSTAPNSAGDRFLTLDFEAAAPPTGDDFSFVVRIPNGDEYLIMNGRAHRMWREQGQSSPLIEDLPVVETGTAWLSAMPVGPILEPLQFPNVGGRPSKDTLGMTIGQLAVVESLGGGENRYYIQLDNGLTQISYLDMRLQMAARGANEPRVISENDLASARNDDLESVSNPLLPVDKPVAPQGYDSLSDVSICMTYSADNTERVTVSIDQPTPAIPATAQRPRGNRIDIIDADTLTGGLFRNWSTPEAESVTFLVTEGKIYPIPDAASRRALGYGDLTPAPVPGQLLALFEPGLAPQTNLSFEHIIPITEDRDQ